MFLCNPLDPDGIDPKTKPCLVTNQASEEFIARINNERKAGYGFVPFVGAGFTAPAGAPLTRDLKPYLKRCILRALIGNPETRWHPRTDQWPPFVDRDFNERKRQPLEPAEELNAYRSTLSKRNTGQTPADVAQQVDTLQRAAGATSDWREALWFLSTLENDSRENGAGSFRCEEYRQEIADSCFREVLRGKSTALNHKMLGVLAGAMRFNLLVTSNFDDLVEKGFTEARNPLQVIGVPIEGKLPAWSAVSKVRTLIKLHGHLHRLRADHTLEDHPSEDDKNHFLEYLLGRTVRNAPQERDFQNHLLVMGVSGSDNRSIELIEHACTKLPKDFRVFWLCYSDEDVRRVGALSEKVQLLNAHGNPGSRNRHGSFCVLKHTNSGLLLMQLYQTIRGNLPPFGAMFPSVSRLTLPPLTDASAPRKNVRTCVARIQDHLDMLGEGTHGPKVDRRYRRRRCSRRNHGVQQSVFSQREQQRLPLAGYE